MPRLTYPVKRVCYADDLTVWASGVNIPDLEVSLKNYLEETTAYMKNNSLPISDPKSSVTLLTPDTHQAKTHPSILIEDLRLPLVKCQRILGIYLDPSLSFNKHSQYVTEREREYQAGTTSLRPWQVHPGDNRRKHYGRKIDHNYAAPVWSPNLHDNNYRKIKCTQNEALRIATGCHRMSSIDHLHTEAEMLKIKEHSEFYVHSTWQDAWNQEMYVIPSQQGLPLRDR